MMKKSILAILLLITSTISFAHTAKLINVFYDGRTEEFAVNTVKVNGQSGFFRTNKIVLITNKISTCTNGCYAEIKGKEYTSFNVVVNGTIVATVTTNDSDNLLNANAFGILSTSSKNELLILNLNKLELDNTAEVK